MAEETQRGGSTRGKHATERKARVETLVTRKAFFFGSREIPFFALSLRLLLGFLEILSQNLLLLGGRRNREPGGKKWGTRNRRERASRRMMEMGA